ncbi:hypothetical protein DPMN_016680 [Dreissena polymorpha]|uniref:Uncharacterized protein n=1 Tax=Dreissena polymorpha TaxID=45954 RepID=A0A9D4S5Q6_DREPO|nr:hypothetical protein DPMN_016680 [Dreissena polymorpha]
MNSIPVTDCYVLECDFCSIVYHGKRATHIAQSYAVFAVKHYGKAAVVFYGYGDDPSIKDSTRQRPENNVNPIVRMLMQKGCPFVFLQKQGRHDYFDKLSSYKI